MLRKSLIVPTTLLLLSALAFTGRAQADATPTPEHMMDMGGTPMPPDEHNHPRIPANGATVKIIAPKDGDLLDRDNVIVRVETTNWPLGEEGHHWHLYVNGKEQGMSQGNAPALQARDLQPGANVIEVTLSNELHEEHDTTDKITIHYGAGEHAAATAAASADPALSPGVVTTLALVAAAVVAILAVGFALMRRKKA